MSERKETNVTEQIQQADKPPSGREGPPYNRCHKTMRFYQLNRNRARSQAISPPRLEKCLRSFGLSMGRAVQSFALRRHALRNDGRGLAASPGKQRPQAPDGHPENENHPQALDTGWGDVKTAMISSLDRFQAQSRWGMSVDDRNPRSRRLATNPIHKI